MKSLAVLMVGITLIYSGKKYYNTETTGFKFLTALWMAGERIFDFGVQVGDDQTGATDAFRQEGDDGEDSLSLDLKERELKFEPVFPRQLASKTVSRIQNRIQNKLNNDRPELMREELYFSPLCSPSRRRTSK